MLLPAPKMADNLRHSIYDVADGSQSTCKRLQPNPLLSVQLLRISRDATRLTSALDSPDTSQSNLGSSSRGSPVSDGKAKAPYELSYVGYRFMIELNGDKTMLLKVDILRLGIDQARIDLP